MSIIELDDFRTYLSPQAPNNEPARPNISPRFSSEPHSGGTAENVHQETSKNPLNREPSPKSSPSVTFRSTPTEISSKSDVASKTSTSGQQSPRSGTTPVLVPGDVILQAISRRQTDPSLSAPRTNIRAVDFKDLAHEHFRDDTLMEPWPYERVRTNLSEIFATHLGSVDSAFDLTGFGGHRDTFAVLGLHSRKARSLELPLNVFGRLLQYTDFDTYLAIRLSCRSWSAAVSQTRPPRFSPVYHLPVEIIQQIYCYLSPFDFNAARHTCRAWMLASLDTGILIHKLESGGWKSAALADEAVVESRPHVAITNDWPLSKRLATECQLRPEWTGSGLRHCFHGSALKPLDPGKTVFRPALSLVTEINFLQLSLLSSFQTRSASQHELGRLFTPSVCGQYLKVAVDSTLFIYKLKKTSQADESDAHHIEPITSMIFPRRILATSMDISCGRFAVAALLEGRVGIVCDLSYRPQVPPSVWTNPSNPRFDISGDDLEVEEPIPNESLAYHDKHGKLAPWAKLEMDFTDSPEAYSICPSPKGIPVETGPRSVHRNLCSAEDPPRSVAICPQRRCVAFGCSGGIELHWTDIVSGQDMSRWFPLANSSDYLYFVPPRLDETTSARQLRLTSSTAHPLRKANLNAKFTPPELQEQQENETVWECMGNLGAYPRTPSPEPTKPDHYRTVPLSDGYHVLFTDPETNHVCLGVLPEATADNLNFTRRIFLLGPKTEDAHHETVIPACYTAAPELLWGVRIAVGYSDGSLWLFSIPRDIFLLSRCLNEDSKLGWLEEYNTSRCIDPPVRSPENRYKVMDWSLCLRGVPIAQIDKLEDVAVDGSNGGVTLWALSGNGIVRKWEMSDGNHKELQQSVVLRDGLIVKATEDDGDWIMRNAPWVPSYTSTPTGYDGTTSTLGFHPAWNLAARHSSHNPVSDRKSGYASDEGEPSTSVDRDSVGSLSWRFSRLHLSGSDAEMFDADEGYESARQSRAPTPMDIDARMPAYESPPEILTSEPQKDFAGVDEGYESDEFSRWARTPAALCVPSLNKRWSGESFEAHDWTPDYLGTKEGSSDDCIGDEDLDLWDLVQVEVKIL